ncbi:3,4-dihydroxy-2-butanone-4-phosphate synthase [Frigidibacter oleivorans]|uniref:3,4-dihydroxy-2-butanone-4-phosphate synthase n=1 Tax=Frigidibacter oleivorans TaxID=2487129 RepID=UPI000F8C4DF3|nr:3,4-dihydroxy-2-butanone-4-phosphate synthase [Frigidibacter oleivorans]
MPESRNAPVSSPLLRASSCLRDGGMLILSEERDKTLFNHLAIAAQFATADRVNFMAKHCRGLVSLILHASIVDRLRLPLAPQSNRSRLATAFTVSIEAREGVSTGISAADRAATIAAAIRPDAAPEDVVSPGHIFAVRVEEGEFRGKPGTASASVELCRVGGLTPAAVLCSMLGRDGGMTSAAEAAEFARHHGIPLVRVESLSGSAG